MVTVVRSWYEFAIRSLANPQTSTAELAMRRFRSELRCVSYRDRHSRTSGPPQLRLSAPGREGRKVVRELPLTHPEPVRHWGQRC